MKFYAALFVCVAVMLLSAGSGKSQAPNVDELRKKIATLERENKQLKDELAQIKDGKKAARSLAEDFLRCALRSGSKRPVLLKMCVKGYAQSFWYHDPHVRMQYPAAGGLAAQVSQRRLTLEIFDEFHIRSEELGAKAEEFVFRGLLKGKGMTRLDWENRREARIVEGTLEDRPGSFSLRVRKEDGEWKVSLFEWQLNPLKKKP